MATRSTPSIPVFICHPWVATPCKFCRTLLLWIGALSSYGHHNFVRPCLDGTCAILSAICASAFGGMPDAGGCTCHQPCGPCCPYDEGPFASCKRSTSANTTIVHPVCARESSERKPQSVSKLRSESNNSCPPKLARNAIFQESLRSFVVIFCLAGAVTHSHRSLAARSPSRCVL